MANKLNMTELEKEIALVENDAIAEEQYNADCNYAVLDKELKIIISSIPFSSVGKYSVGRDYSDVDSKVEYYQKFTRDCRQKFHANCSRR